MTEHDRFESAYRECFPVASSMQPDLFERDDDGYIEAKVHTAFTLWKTSSATPADQDAADAQRYRYLRTGEGEIFPVYGRNGTWGECGHMNIYDDQLDVEIDKAIAASAPKGDGND